MAGPQSPESQALANDESTQDFEPRSLPQFEEDDYHEASVTESVPTKTEEEDGALFDGERPVSAGTAYGTEHDFEHFSDDEAIVARLSVGNEHEVTQPTNAPESEVHGLLVKPEISQPLDGYDFQFSKAQHQPIHTTPNRPVPVSNVMPTPYTTDDESEVYSEYIQPAHQPERRERKRKKTKKHKPQQQTPQEDTIELLDDAAAGRDIVLDTNADRSGKDSPTLHHSQAMDLDREQSTEDLEAMHDVRHRSEDSPHDQLQNEFEAAAEPQRQLSEGPSVATRQVFQRIEDELEVREPSPVHEVNVQPPQDQHESTSSAISRNSGQPTHSTVQKRKSKSSRKAAPAHQEQSAAARTWTISDYAELLKFKIEEEEQARMAAFTAELEALQFEAHSATEARTAIQSELDSVLEQKQQLTGTIQEQKAKIVNYECKFKRFKTFVDGLGKDLDSLKKDANSQRRRSDDIAQEVESQSNRNLAAYLELDERAKDCRKFKDKALKLAQDKDAELQQVLKRQDQLERDSNNAIQDFDKLRARCSDLEQQLKAARDPNDGLMRMLKSNHDALLDKLHLIHASTEDEQMISGIAEWIEKLDLASNTISSSTSSANEDISNIKTLVEALDQR
jgi:chromosome segregation ATPase